MSCLIQKRHVNIDFLCVLLFCETWDYKIVFLLTFATLHMQVCLFFVIEMSSCFSFSTSLVSFQWRHDPYSRLQTWGKSPRQRNNKSKSPLHRFILLPLKDVFFGIQIYRLFNANDMHHKYNVSLPVPSIMSTCPVFAIDLGYRAGSRGSGACGSDTAGASMPSCEYSICFLSSQRLACFISYALWNTWFWSVSTVERLRYFLHNDH